MREIAWIEQPRANASRAVDSEPASVVRARQSSNTSVTAQASVRVTAAAQQLVEQEATRSNGFLVRDGDQTPTRWTIQ